MLCGEVGYAGSQLAPVPLQLMLMLVGASHETLSV